MKTFAFKFIVFFVSIGLLQSCVSIALKSIGANASSAELRILKSKTKTVCFIPMHHVGKKVFYEDVHRITDSLGRSGYVAFYEGVDTNITDTLELDFLKRKWRKMLGFYLDKSGFIDTTNQLFMGKYKISKKYTNQPVPLELISETSQPKSVDVFLEDLIHDFEKKTNKIELDSCDVNTPLNKSYKSCNSLKETHPESYKVFNDEFILDYRNQYLAKTIQDGSHDKVIVIYGRYHFKGLLKELKAIDSTWQKENLK